eukprot:1634548-Prymnesium_polylepis.3
MRAGSIGIDAGVRGTRWRASVQAARGPVWCASAKDERTKVNVAFVHGEGMLVGALHKLGTLSCPGNCGNLLILPDTQKARCPIGRRRRRI